MSAKNPVLHPVLHPAVKHAKTVAENINLKLHQTKLNNLLNRGVQELAVTREQAAELHRQNKQLLEAVTLLRKERIGAVSKIKSLLVLNNIDTKTIANKEKELKTWKKKFADVTEDYNKVYDEVVTDSVAMAVYKEENRALREKLEELTKKTTKGKVKKPKTKKTRAKPYNLRKKC